MRVTDDILNNDGPAAEGTNIPSPAAVVHMIAATRPSVLDLAICFPRVPVADAISAFGSPHGDAAPAGSTVRISDRSFYVRRFSLSAVKKPEEPLSSGTASIVSQRVIAPLHLLRSFASLTYFFFHLRHRPSFFILLSDPCDNTFQRDASFHIC